MSLNANSAPNQHPLQIATSESLTAGMMMSTLTDIPWGGFLKYGCFGVYDTDAKRVFNGVSADNVYTHRCAKEMAVGILHNSNATVGLAVTGNAMPVNDNVDLLGEVFVGIACYKNSSIIYETHVINGCMENIDLDTICRKWYTTIKDKHQYNERSNTAQLSQLIRMYTTEKAFELCTAFVNKHKPDVPHQVICSKKQNAYTTNKSCTHEHIPMNKYDFHMDIKCTNEMCYDVNSCKRTDTFQYNPTQHIKNRLKM